MFSSQYSREKEMVILPIHCADDDSWKVQGVEDHSNIMAENEDCDGNSVRLLIVSFPNCIVLIFYWVTRKLIATTG